MLNFDLLVINFHRWISIGTGALSDQKRVAFNRNFYIGRVLMNFDKTAVGRSTGIFGDRLGSYAR